MSIREDLSVIQEDVDCCLDLSKAMLLAARGLYSRDTSDGTAMRFLVADMQARLEHVLEALGNVGVEVVR